MYLNYTSYNVVKHKQMEQIHDTFSKLSINYEQVSHAACCSLAEWTQTLSLSAKCSNKKTGFMKSLLLKPKGGDDKLVFVVALNTTEMNINALVKKFGYKEARVATDELTLATLNVDKVNCKLNYLITL